MYFYLMIVVIVFALGDVVGHFTKGKLSAMMIVMLLFLVGFPHGSRGENGGISGTTDRHFFG